MEAILIKVAGIGLKINHLGKTLADMQSTLVKLVGLHECHRLAHNSSLAE